MRPGGVAHSIGPPGRQAGGCRLAEAAGREVHGGARRGGRRRDRGATDDRADVGDADVATGPLVQPQPLQRRRPQALHPPGEGPAGAGVCLAAHVAGDGVDDSGHPGGPGEGVHQRALGQVTTARLVLGDRVVQSLGGGAQVGGQAVAGGVLAGDRGGQPLAQGVQPVAGGDRSGQHLGVGEAVPLQQPLQVGDDRGDPVGGQPVGLVEHDDGDRAVGPQHRDVLVVQHGVGVLLRVGDPDEDVDELEHPAGLLPVRALPGVEVGQVHEHQAVEVPGLLGRHLVPPPDGEPVQQLAGRLLAPDGGRRGGGRRPAHPDLGDVVADERVEEG